MIDREKLFALERRFKEDGRWNGAGEVLPTTMALLDLLKILADAERARMEMDERILQLKETEGPM
jgi:hypothetical protein